MDTSEKSRFNVPYGPDRYRRLSEHFHACADLPLKERERYLRDAKIADSGLRDELSSLLRYHAPEAKALAPRPRRKTWHRKPLFLSGIGAAATLLVLAVRTCTVQRLEATEAKVKQGGGKIVKPPFTFPGGRRFHFTDPSGNELAVWTDQ